MMAMIGNKYLAWLTFKKDNPKTQPLDPKP